jgi:hypothetical protein
MTNQIQEKILEYFELLVRNILFWEDDSIRIGKIIRFLHHMVMYSLLISLILVHTVLPSYFLLCCFYMCCFSIWLHHIISGGCISSKLEQKLIGDTSSFVDPFLDLFHIPITKESTVGITIMGSTLIMTMLSLELVCRTILHLKSYLRF